MHGAKRSGPAGRLKHEGIIITFGEILNGSTSFENSYTIDYRLGPDPNESLLHLTYRLKGAPTPPR